MKAYVLKEPYKLEEVDRDEPQIAEPDDVIIAIKVVGICGSDMLSYQGKLELISYPRIIGHEFSGVVDAVGQGVKHVKPGDPVVVEPLISCGRCKPCITGDYNVCETLKVMGVHVDGACQEKLKVKAHKVFKLPDNATLKEGITLEPFSVGLEASLRGRLTIEDKVVIFGAGTIGICVLKAVKCHNARQIISVDIDDGKLERARNMGADHIINSSKEDVEKRVMEITGGKGANLVVEASGVESALAQCFEVTAYRARVTILGFYKSPMVQIPPIHIVIKELDVYGSRVYKNRFPLALDILAKKQVVLTDLITHEFTFDKLEDAIKTAIDPEVDSLKVIVTTY
ncbi:alcohol dehydrogenase catalytic domain-containing protein [Candidatus Poribacteria bacterium]|nr:alcohol dehydrogenase catalytic domain-containing protein [Candidatus Poribacteria bacterium]